MIVGVTAWKVLVFWDDVRDVSTAATAVQALLHDPLNTCIKGGATNHTLSPGERPRTALPTADTTPAKHTIHQLWQASGQSLVLCTSRLGDKCEGNVEKTWNMKKIEF